MFKHGDKVTFRKPGGEQVEAVVLDKIGSTVEYEVFTGTLEEYEAAVAKSGPTASETDRRFWVAYENELVRA